MESDTKEFIWYGDNNTYQTNIQNINININNFYSNGSNSNAQGTKTEHTATAQESKQQTTTLSLPANIAPAYREQSSTLRGRRNETLFADSSTTIRMASLFTEFLNDHCDTDCLVINCSKDNYLNRAFAAFCACTDGMIKKPYCGNACYRFLNDNCGFDSNTSMKTYSDWIRRRNVMAEKPDRIIMKKIMAFLAERTT